MQDRSVQCGLLAATGGFHQLINQNNSGVLKVPFEELRAVRQLSEPSLLGFSNSSGYKSGAGPAQIPVALIVDDQVSVVLHRHVGVVPERFVEAVRAFSNPQAPSGRVEEKAVVADDKLQWLTHLFWMQS